MEKKKIMIVDDEQSIRFVIRRILEKEGYDIIEAESGEECLDRLEQEKPDLILLDVMMPGLDGWTTCSRIKNRDDTKEITISMLTVKRSEEDKIKSFEDSLADWHISKPIDRKDLIKTVKWLLKGPPKRE
ncbi:MAG: PleD family two-component system response regulator [Candidatus Hydrothermarchaeales archaeon]